MQLLDNIRGFMGRKKKNKVVNNPTPIEPETTNVENTVSLDENQNSSEVLETSKDVLVTENVTEPVHFIEFYETGAEDFDDSFSEVVKKEIARYEAFEQAYEKLPLLRAESNEVATVNVAIPIDETVPREVEAEDYYESFEDEIEEIEDQIEYESEFDKEAVEKMPFDLNTSSGRFHFRQVTWILTGKFMASLRHYAWWLLHNVIIHPLIGVAPLNVFLFLHDFTSSAMNLEDETSENLNPVIASHVNYAAWALHNVVIHPLMGLLPCELTFKLHDKTSKWTSDPEYI